VIQFYVFSNSVTEILGWSLAKTGDELPCNGPQCLCEIFFVSLRQQLVSKILMNAADNGIIAAKKS